MILNITSKLDCPHFYVFNLPFAMLSSKECFTLIAFWKLINVAEHAVRVSWVFVCYKEIADVCFSKRRTVFFLILFNCLILLVSFDRAFYRLAPFTISDRKQVSVFRLTIHELAHPTSGIKASKNMAIVCLHKC